MESETQCPIDSEVATALAWSPDCQLITCSDDKSIIKWTTDGTSQGKIAAIDIFITGISWYPTSGKQVRLVTKFDVNLIGTSWKR